MRFLPPIPLTLVLVVFASSANATTWYIKADGTGDAPTIQAGVNLASPGDVVLVAAGAYTASTAITVDGVTRQVCVVIDRAIELKSESGAAVTTIGDAAKNIGIYVKDVSGAAVRGVSIRTGSGGFSCVGPTLAKASVATPPPSFSRGIQCVNSNVILENNDFASNDIAIELSGGSVAQVSHNTISSDPNGVGVYNASADIGNNTFLDCGVAIDCEGSAPSIHDNTISGGCMGVSSSLGSNPTIARNFIHDIDVGYGIQCGGGSATIDENTIASTYGGVRLIGTNGSLLARRNILRNNILGFDITESASGTVEQNTIVGGVDGIRCDIVSSPSLRRNIITSENVGIHCIASSSPLVECNDVFGVGTRYVGIADQTGTNGNISADAEFCGVSGSGNYFLQGDSPCAPGHHPDGADCGLIGALGVGCGVVKTQPATWGAIKAMYRK